ncbi:MAG: sigma 54-interacting transcriptional regulator [Holophaga sp.]|nr:sigma 54-interacting transcriptional regulator [Holophaga sp.]
MSSIGKTPAEIFPNLSPKDSPSYRALHYNEITVDRKLKVGYKGVEYTVIINTFLIIDQGRTIGAVTTAKVLDEEYLRYSINVPEFPAIQQNRLYEVADIIGNSPETTLLRQKIQTVAPMASSVFIYGETGTGKELVAQALHSGSPRRNGRFISQNCAAIPQTLLESLFFGTTKGSFTGAQNKAGIFELANGGTVFLDELNSMDLGMQAKLLKTIEDRMVTRVGGSEARLIDVRIIAAANQSPERSLQDRTIRPDLFFRLSGVQIYLPPLRERKSDIQDLAAHFIRKFNREMSTSVERISPDVLDLFRAYGWPGNIRELKNVMESAFNFITGPLIEPGSLPDYLKRLPATRQPEPTAEEESLHEARARFEKEMITSKAREARNLTELADSLNLSRQALAYKIKKHGLKLFDIG